MQPTRLHFCWVKVTRGQQRKSLPEFWGLKVEDSGPSARSFIVGLAVDGVWPPGDPLVKRQGAPASPKAAEVGSTPRAHAPRAADSAAEASVTAPAPPPLEGATADDTTPSGALNLHAGFSSGRLYVSTSSQPALHERSTDFRPMAEIAALGKGRSNPDLSAAAFSDLPMQIGNIEELGAWALLDATAEDSADLPQRDASLQMLYRPVLGTLGDALAWRASAAGKAWLQDAVSYSLMTFASVNA